MCWLLLLLLGLDKVEFGVPLYQVEFIDTHFIWPESVDNDNFDELIAWSDWIYRKQLCTFLLFKSDSWDELKILSIFGSMHFNGLRVGWV